MFLLSDKEAVKDYFSDGTERMCMPTSYAGQQGELTSDDNGACLWWLRSPGDDLRNATYVLRDGACGNFFVDLDKCVRPALWINLESDI